MLAYILYMDSRTPTRTRTHAYILIYIYMYTQLLKHNEEKDEEIKLHIQTKECLSSTSKVHEKDRDTQRIRANK
jgi:hypothetical protein